MSYIPGAGIKKPLNTMEVPIFPDIKKGPPEFKSAGKHWNVDVGRTLLELGPQHLDHAVLAVSRDENKTRYGQSSHRDYVNEAFRPPIITLEDTLPLNRQPRKQVVPRINPGTADAGGFAAKNEKKNDTLDHITDKVSTAYWDSGYYAPEFGDDNSRRNDMERATKTFMHSTFRDSGYYHPIDVPVDNSVLPDLKRNMPEYSVCAGFETYVTIDAPVQEITLKEKQYTPVIDTRMQSSVDGQTYKLRKHDLEKVKQRRENYSLVLNPEVQYRETNERSYKPHFKEKMKVEGSYTTEGARPMGLHVPDVKLKPKHR